MKLRRFTSTILLAFFTTLCVAQNKPRVAVLDFDYATVQDSVASIFGTNMDIGKGIADLLVEDLVKSGAYSVIERKAIEKIMEEQNFSNSDRSDPASAAKIGKLLGVDAIILGSITQFGRDDKSTNVGGGMLGGLGGKFGIGSVGKKESKAVVAVTARVVSADTAEILAATSGKGESKRSGANLVGTGGSSGGSGIGNVDMASSNFGQTIIGEAVNQAVDTLGTDLEKNAQRVPARTIKVEGLVADVAGSSLVLNVGTSGGVKVGDKLKVTRVTREVKDPATGKVLRRIEENLGEVSITEADETSSVGTFTGAGTVKVGDSVATAPR